MESISFIEAFRQWMNGPAELTNETLIYGVQLYVWSRIGIVLQMLSVFLLFLEIIGAKKLRKFGEQIGTYFDYDALKEISRIFELGREIKQKVEEPPVQKYDFEAKRKNIENMEKDSTYKEFTTATEKANWKHFFRGYLILAVLTAGSMFVFGVRDLKTMIMPLVISLVTLLFAPSVLSLVDRMLIKPIAWVVGEFKYLKLIIAVLIFAGYSLSLLAS